MTPSPVYLDHAATTPVRPEVLEAMLPYLTNQAFGNPSSAHRFGRAARAGIEQARRDVAQAVGAEPNQVIFTSGGTEADNLGIIGAALAARENELTIYCWEGYNSDKVLDPFRTEFDCDVRAQGLISDPDAVNQLRAGPILQGPDAPRQRRLRDVPQLRGTGKAARALEHEQILDPFQLHRMRLACPDRRAFDIDAHRYSDLA